MNKNKVIDEFKGEFRYLSNFFIIPVYYKKNHYKSAEHAFQARKAIREVDREYIANAKIPATSKVRGRSVMCKKDWDKIKIKEMAGIVYCKFFQNKELKKKLCNTKDAKLIEGNTWNDDFWGMIKNEKGKWEGNNYLGKILMAIRKNLCEGKN